MSLPAWASAWWRSARSYGCQCLAQVSAARRLARSEISPSMLACNFQAMRLASHCLLRVFVGSPTSLHTFLATAPPSCVGAERPLCRCRFALNSPEKAGSLVVNHVGPRERAFRKNLKASCWQFRWYVLDFRIQIATRDFIRDDTGSRIAAISDRRTGATGMKGIRREQLAPPCSTPLQLTARRQTFAATAAASICRNTRFGFEMTDWRLHRHSCSVAA